MKIAAHLLSLVLVLVTLLSVQASPASTYAQVKAQDALINRLLSMQALSDAGTGNPAQTADCFSKYLPELSEAQTTFQTQYQACITIATAQMDTLTSQAEANKTEYIDDTNQLCSGFQACQADTQILDFFDCYSAVAYRNVSMLYSLSANASLAASTLAQGIKVIQNDEAQCTNKTEDTYVKSTAYVYQQLDDCLGTGLTATAQPSTVATFVQADAMVGFPMGGMGLVPQGLTSGSSGQQQSQSQGQTLGGIPAGIGEPGSTSDGTTQTKCSNDTSTQISADGSQIQTQTGGGCQTQSVNNSGNSSQSQSSSDGDSQSQSQSSGSQSQSQSSGSQSQSQSSGGQSQSQSNSTQVNNGQNPDQSSIEGIPTMYLPPAIVNNGLPESSLKPIAPMTPDNFLP